MPLRDDITERANARLGTVLKGKWRLNALIGVGGMACVYSATHRNQARVAIKMLHPEVALDAEVTARFLREGYVANAVGHPGTVTVLDDDVTDDNAPFLVMELLIGQTLDAMLTARPEGLPAREVLPLVDQLLDVLAVAHEKGIVHRDVKPENLFLTHEGRLKVLDFGIARLREQSRATDAGTRAGSVLGTPAFMAPEQALGRWNEVDQRTDIWAVGATCFTLLSGRFVHEAESIQEQLVLSATRPAPALRTVAPSVPRAVGEVIDRALSFQRADRFPDARSLRAALRDTSVEVFGERFVPMSLSAPVSSARLSHPDEQQGATLIAPFEVTSAITGRVDAMSTGQPVTRSAEESAAPSRRQRLGVSLVLGMLAIVMGGVIYAAHRASTASAVLTPSALPVIAATPQVAAAAPSLTVAPFDSRQALPAPALGATATTATVRRVAPHPGSVARPIPLGRRRAVPPKTTPSDTNNPFDRRL